MARLWHPAADGARGCVPERRAARFPRRWRWADPRNRCRPRLREPMRCCGTRSAEQRKGCYVPGSLAPGPLAEKALTAVIQRADVWGICSRSVDDLVHAMGKRGISKSRVSRPRSWLWLDPGELASDRGARVHRGCHRGRRQQCAAARPTVRLTGDPRRLLI
jgi:Transposase, Mutator family